jgi:hypothetical protein
MSTNTMGYQLTYAQVWATTGDVIEDAFAHRRDRSRRRDFPPPSRLELRGVASRAVTSLGGPSRGDDLPPAGPIPDPRQDVWVGC